MVTIPTLRAAIRAAVAPLLAYAITLATSLVLMVLVVVGIALADGSDASSDDPSDSVDIKAIATLIGMPFQLAAMGLGGSLGLGDEDFGLRLFAPPLLLTMIFAIATFKLAKRAEKTTATGSTVERLILSASGSLITAVTATTATRVLAMRDDETVMHAATVGLFFGTLIVAAVAGALGRIAARASLWPRWLPADGRRALHLITQHAAFWIVALTPIIAIWAAIDSSPEAAIYTLVWAPTTALWAMGMGHLGALSAFGEDAFAWDFGWFPGVVLPVLAVGFTLIASIAWHLRRRTDVELLANPVSWATLPAAYTALGIVIPLVSVVGVSGDFYGVGGGLKVFLAFWLIPVLAIWGTAIEALSRFVAPALVTVLPSAVQSRLGKGPRFLVSPPPPPKHQLPMTPTDKARAKKALIGIGVVAGLAIVGTIALAVIGSIVSSPEKQAESYLNAILGEDLDEVLDLAPLDDDDDDVSKALLTAEIYKAADDRITGYDITDVDEHGSRVTITVDLEGPDDSDDIELTLKKDGHKAVFFDNWKVEDNGLMRQVSVSIPESSDALEVNDVTVDSDVESGETATFWALPGTYNFDPYADNKWLTAADNSTTVPVEQTYGTYAEIDSPEPSAELTEAINSQVEEWVNGCMASTELDPDDCPQSAYGSGEKQRKAVWTLDTMPTVKLDYFSGSFPASTSTDVDGQATVTYEYDASYGFGSPEWTKETETVDLYVSAEVDLVDDEVKVTFESY